MRVITQRKVYWQEIYSYMLCVCVCVMCILLFWRYFEYFINFQYIPNKNFAIDLKRMCRYQNIRQTNIEWGNTNIQYKHGVEVILSRTLSIRSAISVSQMKFKKRKEKSTFGTQLEHSTRLFALFRNSMPINCMADNISKYCMRCKQCYLERAKSWKKQTHKWKLTMLLAPKKLLL